MVIATKEGIAASAIAETDEVSEELLELELELEELELLELLEGRLEELEELSSAVQPPVQPESPRARTRAAAVRRAADRFLFIRITRSSFRCLGP